MTQSRLAPVGVVVAMIVAALPVMPRVAQSRGRAQPPSTSAPVARPQGGTPAQVEQARADIRAEKEFVLRAVTGGIKAIELSRLAVDRATGPEVKRFAKQMLDDHSKANDELKNILASKDMVLPGDVWKTPAAVKELVNLRGARFDKKYMVVQVEDLEKTVTLFERQADEGVDPELKAFASQMLPALHEHLKQASGIHARLSPP